MPNIEKILFPKSNRLVKKSGTYFAQIVDAELDPIQCTFNYDNCVELNVDGYEYITLTKENLETLLNLIDESNQRYLFFNSKTK